MAGTFAEPRPQVAALDLRLDGYIEGDFARFEFTDEDLITPWAQFAGR